MNFSVFSKFCYKSELLYLQKSTNYFSLFLLPVNQDKFKELGGVWEVILIFIFNVWNLIIRKPGKSMEKKIYLPNNTAQ